jgi:hypothetical protein
MQLLGDSVANRSDALPSEGVLARHQADPIGAAVARVEQIVSAPVSRRPWASRHFETLCQIQSALETFQGTIQMLFPGMTPGHFRFISKGQDQVPGLPP